MEKRFINTEEEKSGVCRGSITKPITWQSNRAIEYKKSLRSTFKNG